MESQIKSLIEYRKELGEEDAHLKKIAAQIQEQLSSLEVERLALAQIVAKSKEKTEPEIKNIKMSPNSRLKELNLNVPSYFHAKHNVEEEEEDEDEY